MGFGILFFGYLLAFGFSFYFFADIAAVVGCLVMLFGCAKLSEYNRYFNGAILSLTVLVLCSLVSPLTSLLRVFSSVAEEVWTVLDIAKPVAALAVHSFLFLGIRGISLGASCDKLVKTSVRNMVMTVTYYVVSLVVQLTGHWYRTIADAIEPWLAVYWLVCLVLNLVLLYKAFGILCPADEDPNRKKRSRFRFINFIDDKMDSFEENSKKYREDSMKMALDEADRLKKEREQKRREGHSKKKKKK